MSLCPTCLDQDVEVELVQELIVEDIYDPSKEDCHSELESECLVCPNCDEVFIIEETTLQYLEDGIESYIHINC